ncbi:MAG: minor capsid protein [Clostridiales bacterium]|nr:minor capsid protein [Clostridiales bacterium]
MKNNEYWKLRFEQLEAAQAKQGATAYAEIERQYREAQKQLEGQIARWYQRFADNNGITLAQARQYLKGADLQEFKWNVQDYIKYGQDNALTGRWMKELENASAKYHISKLEALKIQTQQSLEVMFSKQLGTVGGALHDVFESGYYHTAYELQKGFNIGWDIAGLDQSQIEKVLAKPWAVDGKNFSERIWTNKEKLISEVHSELTQNIMLGGDPQKAIDSLAKKMNTSKHNVGRLIMTEEAYFSSAAQKDCFNDLDVEEYEIVATLDSNTSDICRSLDGKVFPMKDFQPGITAPPFHVYCRSTTVPHFSEDFGDIGERVARDEKTGKIYYVPDDMNYEEWKRTFVDSNDKSGFDIVDNNSILHYRKKGGQDNTEYDIIKKNFDIAGGTKKLQIAMNENDYQEYLNCLENHKNPAIQQLYSDHADGISEIKYSVYDGYYQPHQNTIVFSYPEQRYLDNGMSKYSTLAHEYGHYFDSKCNYEHITFNELDTISNHTTYGSTLFKRKASSSDEFLTAVRADRESLKKKLTAEALADLKEHAASSGVQDAISGMFRGAYGKIVNWGHEESYYNRRYNGIKKLNDHKGLQAAYKKLGINASSQTDVKRECRIYETASEMWANIVSAEVNGGAELEYVQKYLPNSYTVLLQILKGLN